MTRALATGKRKREGNVRVYVTLQRVLVTIVTVKSTMYDCYIF
jgi:hypothetical protein